MTECTASRDATHQQSGVIINYLIHNRQKIPAIVKCQNLCYLNLSFYFNLMPFLNPFMLFIISTLLLPRHSTPIIQCASYFTLFPFQLTHTTFTPNCQQNRSVCAIPFAILLFPTPLLSAHPSLYFVSQLFPQS